MRLIPVLLAICVTILVGSCSTTDERLDPVKLKPKAECTKKPIVIAIIDTGFDDGQLGLKVRLCKFGHKDFTKMQKFSEPGYFDTVDPVPKDKHGHGTHIAGIIDGILKKTKVNYCLVILKYYDAVALYSENAEATQKAIKYAKNIHADYANYSGGGMAEIISEKIAVKEFIDAGGRFLAAAGNEKSDLAKNHYYPAMDDDRVIVVGSMDGEKHASYSNYGSRVNRWEKGTHVPVCGDNNLCTYMTGTSQATAIATGKLVAQEKNTCN